MTPETQNLAQILISHLRTMTEFARQIPADKFDWTYAPPAPTPRILVTHAYQWLVCDRAHIEEPDASKHSRVPDPPENQSELCDALDAETNKWLTLLKEMTDEKMEEKRHQFNNREFDWSIRGIVYHMVQNCIYKNGQLSTIYFALGLDGDAPYDAPFPNPIYAEIFGPKGER